MTLKKWLIQLSETLESQNQAEQLLQWILDCSWSDLKLNSHQEFPKKKEKILENSMKRLIEGEPLAYIRGFQYFYKENFLVTPHVLIPRPETELIVEHCIELNSSENPIIFDLGTGSGCIGLSMAKELPQAEVLLFDSSTKALDVAKRNAKELKTNNVSFHHGRIGLDVFEIEAYLEKIDFVLGNPPYIAHGDSRVEKSVMTFEPHEALYANNNGLEWIHKWLTWGYDYLKADGRLLFEFGDGQEAQVKKIIELTDYKFEKFIKDYSNKIRFVLLSK